MKEKSAGGLDMATAQTDREYTPPYLFMRSWEGPGNWDEEVFWDRDRRMNT